MSGEGIMFAGAVGEVSIPVRAAPTLLAAARLALPALQAQFETLLEVGCDPGAGGQPDRDTLDPNLESEVHQLETAIDAIEAAILLATAPKHLTVEDVQHGAR